MISSRQDPRSRDDEALLDLIASWLALRDEAPPVVDLVLLFGGSLPNAWDATAEVVLGGRVRTLMLVGGRGHTTDVLERTLGATPGGTEADLMARYLQERYGMHDFLVERDSTNCGSNVTLAKAVAMGHGLRPRTVGLVQEPTMQRRMDAVVRLVWPECIPINLPGPDARHLWGPARWTSLVMGEVPRLRDDEHGYGPRGSGFLSHVDVPSHIDEAHRELLRRHPAWGREAG